jgi:hypothetical protein
MLLADSVDQKYEIIVKILTKLTETHQNIHTMGQFSENARMKYFENHIFTMWEGSLENLYQQIGSNKLFGKRSVQEHCVENFVQKNRDCQR